MEDSLFEAEAHDHERFELFETNDVCFGDHITGPLTYDLPMTTFMQSSLHINSQMLNTSILDLNNQINHDYSNNVMNAHSNLLNNHQNNNSHSGSSSSSSSSKAAKKNSSSSTAAGAAGSKKKKPDKGKVRRAPSAFILFCGAKRKDIKVTHPDANFVDTGKILGEQWSQLDAASKEIYTKQAAEKKAILDVEKAEQKAKDPPKVSRPPTPYMIFCSQARVKMKTTHPNATFAESGRILGNMWSTLDAASKEVYVKAANEHKSAWLAQSKLLSEQQQLQKDEEERQQQEQQSSIKVKLPKQPPSPFTIFSQQVRDQVRTKHPDASFGDLGRILEAMWSSLNKRDKEVYEQAAAQQRSVWSGV